MTDIPSLLTSIKACNGQLTDEVLGRAICLLKGVEFGHVVISRHESFMVYDAKLNLVYQEQLSYARTIDAALALVRERWPKMEDASIEIDVEWKAFLFSFVPDLRLGDEHGAWVHSGKSSSLPLAIFEASLSALSKEGQAI